MNFKKALSLSLGEIEEPVVTRYRLGLIVHKLYVTKSYKGEQLNRLERDYAGAIEFNHAVSGLEASGILKSHPNFRNMGYRLLGRKETNSEEVACTIDPFCYVSHLSAMVYHGITNRLPVKLFLSGPQPQRWKVEADKLMKKHLGDELEVYLSEEMPRLTRVSMKRIGQVEIHRFNSIHWGAYKNVRGKPTRISTLGRTFLDMLRNPDLCGGMNHVVDVFLEHASMYERPIVDEIERHGSPIDKVRAGYLLEEQLGLRNEVVDGWTAFAQRGGSRKLDAAGDYVADWSDKWCLSKNLD